MRKLKFVKGNIYHIFNRGVEKRNIFLNDSDRWRFLQAMFLFNNEDNSTNLLWQIEREQGETKFPLVLNRVKHQDKKPLVRIMADCLMPNHYHLILEEVREGGISNFMHRLAVGYTKYFNKKYDRVGSLFQGPFKAVLVNNDVYLQYLLVYLNVINPAELISPNLKETGIKDINRVMDFAAEYPWSTHQEYIGERNSIIIDKGILGDIFQGLDYEQFSKDTIYANKFKIINDILLE